MRPRDVRGRRGVCGIHLKRRSFPVLDFRQAVACKIQGRRTAPEGKNRHSEDRKWMTGCILSDDGNAKWKSRIMPLA